jgi:hypothetical protein
MKPDSVFYLDSLPAEVKHKKGWVYFFRYKDAKDDNFWKLASAGLLPGKPGEIFDEDVNESAYTSVVPGFHTEFPKQGTGLFTEFSDVRLKDDEPLKTQLNKQLKKILISNQKSGAMFYRDIPENDYSLLRYFD